MEKISWIDNVRNEEILLKIHGGEKYPKKNNKKEDKDTLLKER